eukprot:4652137-Heterocapsa_arctica.AAC.1
MPPPAQPPQPGLDASAHQRSARQQQSAGQGQPEHAAPGDQAQQGLPVRHEVPTGPSSHWHDPAKVAQQMRAEEVDAAQRRPKRAKTHGDEGESDVIAESRVSVKLRNNLSQ